MVLSEDKKNVLNCLPSSTEDIPEDINAYFDELRQTGDVVADSLVKDTLFPNDKFRKLGRKGYNHLLDIADILAESPALALNSQTVVAKELSEYPEELQNYYDPIIAPDWVDEKKLALASKLWQQDVLAVVSVLYGVSLPACYLMKNGITALYDSAKLADRKYIYQRIYETGLLLDAVLGPDGFRVIADLDHTHDEHLVDSLNKTDPEGKWEWRGNTLVRGDAEATASTRDTLCEAVKNNTDKPKRYLWGKGYVTAKKVRFLHATMRFMLQNPSAMSHGRPPKTGKSNFLESIQQNTEPYDIDTLGIPVNQEDQVYTLLTIAYCIPKGLEKFGRYWSDEERDAFLHTWCVVGYTMGIQENLLPKSWNEAEKLFEFIQRRQVGPSEQAKKLTETVVYFFQDYFPKHFGLSRGLATRLIVDQIGDTHAKMILPADYLTEANRPIVVRVFSITMKVLWLYYRARKLIFKIPYLAGFFRGVFYETGKNLIQSWRDAYSRKPFYVPLTVNTWKREKGVNEAFLTKLRDWRHKLFNTMALGLACMIGAGLSFVFFLMFTLFNAEYMACVTGWVATSLVLLGVFVLHYSLGKVSEKRPVLSEDKDLIL